MPRPPTRSKSIYSPLQRGGVGGGAVGLRALFYREVTGVGLLYIYAILRAFSETHQITVWKHGFQVVKTRVSGRETKGFRVWNQGFCKWGVSLLKSVRKRNNIGSDCYIINKYFVKRCKIPFLHIYTAFVYLCRFCIFMQVLRTFAVLVFYLFLPFYFFCHVETKT